MVQMRIIDINVTFQCQQVLSHPHIDLMSELMFLTVIFKLGASKNSKIKVGKSPTFPHLHRVASLLLATETYNIAISVK